LSKFYAWADWLGAQSFQAFLHMRQALRLSLQSLLVLVQLQWVSRPAVRHVVVRQLYFTGVQGVNWVLPMATVAGLLIVYNIVAFARQIQDLALIGSLLGGVFLQEIAPMLIAAFLLMRSGVAVVTEVGNMQARGESTLLASLGISENEYLYMPRLLGFAVSGLVLTFIFALLSIWIGGAVVAVTNTLTFSEFMFEIRRGVGFLDISIMIFKSMLYPVLTVLVLISQGYKVGDNPNQIPVRASFGMLGSLSLICVADVVILLVMGLF